MKRRTATSLGLLLLGLLPGCSRPGPPEAWDLLRRAEEAEQGVSYVGLLHTVTHFRQQRVACAVKVYRQAPDRERMEYQSEPLTGLVTGGDGGHRWYYDPAVGLTLEPARPLGANGAQWARLRRRNYRAEVTGTDRVAGRDTYLLSLTPRHPGNPSRRLWVDRQTGLILKQERYDAEGLLTTQTAFQAIDFRARLDPDLFAPPPSPEVHRASGEPPTWTRAQVEREVGFPVRLPQYVPPGYEVAGYDVHRCGCGCGMISAQVQYVDGLNMFSLFETDAAHASCLSPTGCPAHETGETPCFLADYGLAKSVSVLTTDPLFVVVGDLAEEELARIAGSLK